MENKIHNNEEGFVLVLSLLMLVLLTIIGIAATRTTTVELNIAGNGKVGKQTFYQADGATEIGAELVEQNIACAVGFETAPGGLDNNDPTTFFSIGGVDVFDDSFAFDESMGDIAHAAGTMAGTPAQNLAQLPALNVRSLRIPGDRVNRDAIPVTNVAVWGQTLLATGSAIQLAQGYEGKGKGAAAGGAYIAYQIHAQHLGLTNSASIVRLDWHHLIGFEGNCTY